MFINNLPSPCCLPRKDFFDREGFHACVRAMARGV